MEGGFIPDYLRDLNTVSILLRYILACICGGMVGLERGVKGRAAGFRTHILVCVGAVASMMCGQYIQAFVAPNADPARLGAQVISGIGFLGVGTIIITKSSKVKGLTTAAGLWSSACIGLAIGVGFYETAIIGALTISIVMSLMQYIDKFFYARSKITDLYIEIEHIGMIKEIIQMLKENSYKMVSMELRKSRLVEDNQIGVLMTIKKADSNYAKDVVEILASMEGILYLEEIY